MKVDLTSLVPVLVLAGGIVFGYAQLTSKVDAYVEYDDTDIRTLIDDNMNRIIALEVKLDIAEMMLREYSSQQ